jgi:predicted negative regulator of RcsB-dependent stress response
MTGIYLYLFVVLAVLGLLGYKMYLQRQPWAEQHRPTAPITDADILEAIRTKRTKHAIQLYGLLHQCDLAQATLAVMDLSAQLKTDEAEATSAEPPSDQRGM